MKLENIAFSMKKDIGNVKEVNQDKVFGAVELNGINKFGIFAVADGMGGYTDGEIASQIVIDNIEQWWEEIMPILLSNNKDEILSFVSSSLEKTIERANFRIMEYSKSINKNVGTTVSMIFIYEDSFIVKHIGDSRIYRINRETERLTEDHSWVAEQVRYGNLTEMEAVNHPRRHVLTRCLGFKDDIEVFSLTGKVREDDRYLLCSDGLYKLLKEREILQCINDERMNLDDLPALFVNTVKRRGERDNISCIIVKTIFDYNHEDDYEDYYENDHEEEMNFLRKIKKLIDNFREIFQK